MKIICDYFMENSKPKIFNPHDPHNVTLEHEKSFENVCISLNENGIDTKNVTIFEFYSRVEYFEKKYEKMKQNVKH